MIIGIKLKQVKKKKIEFYSDELNEYRNALKEHDLTLLGLVTDGGVGLQTGNNGKFVGVLDGTHWADKIIDSRPERFFKAIKKYSIKEFSFINSKNEAMMFLEKKDELEIRELFDNLKLKYGRDIFGRGYLYRIVSDSEIADLNNISEVEKEKGILSSKPSFVLYDKGDKEGNRWYLKTPYYIDWSEENVKFLKENSGKKGSGMPVVRNPKFYFKEGFCWSDIQKVYIKSRLKSNGIYDVKSMSLFSLTDKFPDWFIVCMLNSKFLGEYVDNFVNNTVSFQMNDARSLPIVVPSSEELLEFKKVFDKAFVIRNKISSGELSKKEGDLELQNLQTINDELTYKLYSSII